MAITVTLALTIRPGRVEEFKALAKELLVDTRAFEGCQRVDVYQDQDSSDVIYLIEVWDSKEHQQRYQAWREETGSADTLGPFLAGEPRRNFFDMLNI